MPRNVATPEQSSAARAQVQNFPNQNRFKRTRPLTSFERKALQAPVEGVYLYNISPIYKWQKNFNGLGMLTLFPRKADEPYSPAIVLGNRLVRTFDGGNNIQRLMVEEPLEIAEDFMVCSKEYPGRPENNLTGYGVFYTIGQPIDDFTPAERQDILDDAELKHRNKLHENVARGDAFYNSSNLQYAIGELEKKSALYLHEVEQMELPDWVARRAKLNPTAECRFCGFENKRGIAKCRNCHEILDPALYAKLQADSKKPS